MSTTISDTLLRSLAPVREVGAHKWGVGGVLVIAGSPAYPGAAWLASRSAGRNGAGIVYLATPRSVITTMAGAMPEVAFVPLPDTDAPGAARRAVERLHDPVEKVRAIVIGPGLGDDDSTDLLLSTLFAFGEHGDHGGFNIGFAGDSLPTSTHQSILERTDVPLVLDADGLNWLSKQGDWWELVPAQRLVLTPHPGEAQRLSGIDVETIVADPAGTAEKLARKWNQIIVIKSGFAAVSDGNTTLVADLAPTSLATAGSGDCFAGAIGAFIAQGCAPVDAATLAIGIGTRAATELEQAWGMGGVIATDLPDAMAKAMLALS